MSVQVAEETALYHIHGAEDLLLYIGISNDFGRRWKDESRLFPWWSERRRMTVIWYESREEAAAAETIAINTENPKYNIARPTPDIISSLRRHNGHPCMYEAELLAIPPNIDIGTAGRAFGLSLVSSRELVRAGEFPCPVKRFGNRYRVLKVDLLASLGYAPVAAPPVSGTAA